MDTTHIDIIIIVVVINIITIDTSGLTLVF